MSIADIFKIQTAYNQNNTFNDQTSWKDAFNIANAFAETSEKQRANRENLATSDWRVHYQNKNYQDLANQADWNVRTREATGQNKINFDNWKMGNDIAQGNLKLQDLQRLYSNALQIDPSANQAAIAQNTLQATQANIARSGVEGQDAAIKALQQYGFNPDGMPRTLPEAYAAMRADGKDLTNPYALSPFHQQALEERKNQQIFGQTLIQNSQEMTTDSLGNLVPTGRVDQAKFNQNLNHAVATGMMTQEQANGLRLNIYPPEPNQGVLIGNQFQSSLKNLGLPMEGLAPYALTTGQAINSDVVQPAQTTVEQGQVIPPQGAMDYRTAYRLTDQDMTNINQLMALTGKTEQEAFNDLRGYFLARNGNLQSPETVEKLIQQELDSARRVQDAKTWIPQQQVQAMNGINHLLGNQRVVSKPLFNGINRY